MRVRRETAHVSCLNLVSSCFALSCLALSSSHYYQPLTLGSLVHSTGVSAGTQGEFAEGEADDRCEDELERCE